MSVEWTRIAAVYPVQKVLSFDDFIRESGQFNFKNESRSHFLFGS